MKNFTILILCFLHISALKASSIDTTGTVLVLDTTHVMCHGESYMGYTESGLYLDTILSNNICTLRTIELNVFPQTPDEYELMCVAANDPLSHGQYTTVLIDSNGCEYFKILEVVIQPEDIITQLYICEDDLPYTGDPTTELNDMGPCPYNHVINLTVSASTSDVIYDITICEGESYTWNGNTYSETGNYISVFADAGGCEYNEILNLNILPLSNSACNNTSTNDLALETLLIYPIPTSDMLYLKYDGDEILSSYVIYDLSGTLVQQSGKFSNRISTQGLQEGMYLIRLDSENGNSIEKRIVVAR